eukprot:g3792.t1
MEFSNNVVSDSQALLTTVDPTCTDIVLDNVILHENRCGESGCVDLSLNNTLRNVLLFGNRRAIGTKQTVTPTGFTMPLDSKTIATNISASRNEIRLFSILDSIFTIMESSFEENKLDGMDGDITVSFGGSVLWSTASTVNIIDSVFVNNSGLNGGAIYAVSSDYNITRSIFHGNNAGNGNGGVIFTSDSKVNCYLVSFDENYAAADGGVIFMKYGILSFLDGNVTDNSGKRAMFHCLNSTVQISRAIFQNNVAGSYGGGVYSLASNVSVSGSSFINNSIGKDGVGIYARTGSIVHVSDTLFYNNTTEDDASGFYASYSTVYINNTNFTSNTAYKRGNCYLYRSTGDLSNVIFTSNIATTGSAGGLYSFNSNITVSQSLFLYNSAAENGGAIYVQRQSRIEVSDTLFKNNKARDGGGIAGLMSELRITNSICKSNNASIGGGGMAFNSCNVTISGTKIISNQAKEAGGLVMYNDSQLIAKNLSLQSNLALVSGGGMRVHDGASLLCTQCQFHNNIAERGAGLSVETNGLIPVVAQLQDSSFVNNNASRYGGGMLLSHATNITMKCTASNTTCSHVVLLNIEFLNNIAGQSGAAILTSDPEAVLVSCSKQQLQRRFPNSTQLSSLQIISPVRQCKSWRRNKVARKTSCDSISTFGRFIHLSTKPNEKGKVKSAVNSTLMLENVVSGAPLPVIFMTILDAYGNGPSSTSTDTFEATMNSPDGFFQGVFFTNITEGIGNFSNIVGFVPSGKYRLTISPHTTSLPIAEIVVQVRGCQVGEEPTENGVLCQKCDAVTYNFNPAQPGGCTPCPSDATCNTRFIVPKDGYWHKSPCHKNVKECLTDEACSYSERQEKLKDYSKNLLDCQFNESMLLNYSEVLCREGYEGPLCGSCTGSYGLSLGFKCSKCLHDFESVITLFLFTLYLFAISAFSIRGGLPIIINSRHSRTTLSIRSGRFYEVIREHSQEAANESQVIEMIPNNHTPSRETSQVSENLPTHPSQYNELDLTRWITTEIFKVLINFLQVNAIAATINIQWSGEILLMFEVSEYIGALTTDALSRPIDCLASSTSASVRSIWRTLLSLFIPGIVMVIFFGFWSYITIFQNKGVFYFYKRVALSIIAVTYISYLGLTKLAIRVFYCVDVYDSNDPFVDSQNKLWAVDTSIQCYKMEHIPLVVIAVFILIFVSFLFPLMSAFILSRNKVQHRQVESWTMETMGFLYRAFKEEFVFWESLIMLKKACLSLIVVFSYPLGGQLQGILALVVLQISLYLHLVYSPYRKEFNCINFYESGSLLVSCFTFILSLIFSIENCSNSTKVFIALVIIMMNTMFFVFLLYVLFKNGLIHLKVRLRSENHFVDENICWWKAIKIYITSRLKKLTSTRN